MCFGDVVVDPIENRPHSEFCVPALLVAVVGEQYGRPVEAADATRDCDSQIVEHRKIELLAAVRAAHGEARRLLDEAMTDVGGRLMQVADRVQPVPDVATAVPAHAACVLPDGEDDVPAR